VGYAHHAREEYAWARRAFDEALVLDPDHEDALAGIGETLLKFGQRDAALNCFRRTLELGYADDLDLMLQVGRALFREGMIEPAREFFEIAVQNAPENAEAVSCVGYAQHRLGEDEAAIVTLRAALRLDPEHVEARIYLGNILYDRGDYEAALYHLDKSEPVDHWDELGIWRLIELKKSIFKLADGDPELKPWEDRVRELTGDVDDIDEMLAEIEAGAMERDQQVARGQIEVFGALLNSLVEGNGESEATQDAQSPAVEAQPLPAAHHLIESGGHTYQGTWEEIVQQMRDQKAAGLPIEQYMATEARRGYGKTGVEIPWRDPESFIKGSATAGLLRIDR
jgi:tetratricopeptide (TPR) repeat protein